MISTFIAVFVVLMLVVIGMGVGVIFGREPIKGSCGGLGNVGIERACGCTDVCVNTLTPIENGGTAPSISTVKRYQP